MPILDTWVTLVIISTPPILLEYVAGVYGCLSIDAFYNRSKLNETRSNNGPNLNLNANRYIRLIFFSACTLLCGIPITLFYLYLTIMSLVPFPGLIQQHNNFSQIIQLPAVDWRADTLKELSYELNRWMIIFGAIAFFAIFGFTEESRNNYRAMFQYVVRIFGKITGIRSRPSCKTEECVYILFFLFFFTHSLLILIFRYTRNLSFRIVFYNPESHGSSDKSRPGLSSNTERCVYIVFFSFPFCSPSDIILLEICYLESYTIPSHMVSYSSEDDLPESY